MKANRIVKLIAATSIVFIVATAALVTLANSFLPTSQQPEETPNTFTSQVGRYWTVDPATTRVEVTVTNNGTKAAIPNCYLAVQNSSGSYKGSKLEAGPEIAAGATAAIQIDVPISNEGAQYITEGTSHCMPIS